MKSGKARLRPGIPEKENAGTIVSVPAFACQATHPLPVTLLRLPTLDFARLLIVTPVAKLLEGAFLVQLLLQPAESAIDDFTFLHANFGIHNKLTPFASDVIVSTYIVLIYFDFRKKQAPTCKVVGFDIPGKKRPVIARAKRNDG